MGLIASENTIQSELLQTTLAQKGVSAEKSKAILVELGLMDAETGEILSQKACTKADLEAILAQKGITGAQAEGIISALGLSGANKGLTVSFGLLGKAIWGVTKALLSNPITWIVVGFAGLVAITEALTTSTEEYKEQLDDLKNENNEITSEIQSVNSELKTTIDRMKELEGKESLTFTEKEEYDNLVKTNNELQRKIDLLEIEKKQKNKEKNKTFVNTMVSDTEDPFEYEVNPNGKTEGQYQISDNYLTSETGNIEAQFEIRDQLLEDLANAETEKEKERIQKRIDEIEKYLNDKNDEWKNVSDGINYIENPTTEDDKAVNEWLDYINDFQDRMAIAMSKDDASSNAKYKTNTFNRVVDNWQFDETVQGLQDLGKEGKVTAEMLDDPKYDDFINKLVFLGVIDSADNLEDVALAFNSVATSADNAADSASKYTNETDNLSGKSFKQIWNLKGFEETKDKLKELATSGELSPKVLKDTEEYKTLIDKLGILADKAYHKIQKLTLKDINDDIGSYTALLGKIRKGQSLSAKEASSFIKKNASLAGSLVKVGNGYSFEENAIVQLLNTSIEGKNVIISSQIAATQTTIKQVNNRIKAYKTELKALIETLKKQAQAYEAVVELQSNTGIYLPSDAYGDYAKNSNRKKELEGLIEKAEKNQKKNKKRLQSLQKELSNLENTSSGNASSSNSGSSSSSSSKQQFDWIEKRLDHLANKTQKTIDKINNYVSQRTKRGLYKTLLNNIQDEIDANDKATKKYTQKANSVTISKDKKKDATLKQKLRTGAIKGNTKSLIQEYGEETAEKMEKYLNWYEKSQNAKQTAREKRQELLDKKREALDSQINYDNDKLNRLKTMADKYQYNIGLAEAKGLEPSKKSYTNLIKNSKDQISNLKDQNTELKEYQKGLKKGSDEWYDIQQQIDDNNVSIQDLTKSQVEWNAEIRRIPLKIVQSMADLLESVKNSVQSLIDLRKQLNKYASLSDVKKEITLKRQDTYYKTREMQELTRGDLNEALTNEGLNNTQKQQYIKYLEQLAKGDITEGKFFELIGKLGISKSDYNRNTLLKDTTNSILDDYSTILSNTSEIDQLAEGYLDTQISKLQEQRDLLNEINDAKSKAIELEKKQQALQEAKQNKTNLIYHEGFGFSYEADQSAINDAQRDLDDYNFELDQEQFDKAINILEEIRDNKSYVELRENGDTFFPNIDQWVGSIVKSLSSANISLNFSLDKDGNISTSPKLAKGTKYAKGGMSIVGENGAEMRLLNQGDAILPHDVTENLWKFGLNPQQMIMDNLNIKIPDYSNLIEPKTTVTSKVVNIQNVTLPNINDLSKAQELFDGLITINSDAQQRAWKR